MNDFVTLCTCTGCGLSVSPSTTGDMSGVSNTWNPASYIRHRHPDVRVVEADLPGSLMGCVDHEQRIIWLARHLDDVERRCTLAYEIAQFEQGPTPIDPRLAHARELAALDWAARQLIPSEDMAAAFGACHTIAQAAVWLAVDVPTVRARLRGLMDDEQDAVMSAIHHLHRESAG